MRSRPRTYRPELADYILRKIAEGENLRDICKGEGMPNRQTVLNWRESVDGFSARYARARLAAAEAAEEEVCELAREVRKGKIDPDAARVAGNLLTWLAQVKDPSRYSTRQRLDVNTREVKTLADMSDEELRIGLAHLTGEQVTRALPATIEGESTQVQS